MIVKLTTIQKSSFHILTGDQDFECLIFDLWLLLNMQSTERRAESWSVGGNGMGARVGPRQPSFGLCFEAREMEVEGALRPALRDGLFQVLRSQDQSSHATNKTETRTSSTLCSYTDHGPWLQNEMPVPSNTIRIYVNAKWLRFSRKCTHSLRFDQKFVRWEASPFDAGLCYKKK